MALFGLLGGKKTSVGLDIGSGIIKLAVIDHSGSEPELVKVATTEVAADAIVEGGSHGPRARVGSDPGPVFHSGRQQRSGGDGGGWPGRHRQEDPDGPDERRGRPER